MKIVEAQAQPHEHLRSRTLQQCLTALIVIFANLSIVDDCRDADYTSGNSAT